MPSIALIHSGKSFMPEVQAYQDHFEKLGCRARILIDPGQKEMEYFDILWFFMGLQPALDSKNRRKVIVHEYCSASTPPMAGLKDLLKKIINPVPGFRISLVHQHQGKVFPMDDVPLILRKQGVHDCFYEKPVFPKQYDFIYTGSALKIRNTEKWLRAFLQSFPDKTILLTGNHEPSITTRFRKNPNIQFHPPADIKALPKLLAQSRFAVNYVPDQYPFNIQPSTKLLEYCAAGCSILSNRYKWVEQFDREMKTGLFFIEDDFSNLSYNSLEKHAATTADMNEYRWESVFMSMDLNRILAYQPTT